MLKQRALEITPVAGRIGAEISGLRLSRDLDDGQIRAIREALLRHKVIFFRKQDHLDDEEQEAFAVRLGTLAPHPTERTASGTKSIQSVISDGTNAANQWHTDLTFLADYASVTLLRSFVLPSKGGDTIWANTVTAYEEMSAPIQDLMDRLWALHSNAHDFSAARIDQAERRRVKPPAHIYETEHPVVRVHPETGERSLVMGNHMVRILEVSREESFYLQQMAQHHITRPENTVRWSWRRGDVAIWDNRATQHYGIGDFTEARELRRVSLKGDIPVSVDGRSSVGRTLRINPDAEVVAAN
jgi:taurine dioxygenase